MAAPFIRSSFSSAATCAEPLPASAHATFQVRDYDLGATLNSGQAFRWEFRDKGWNGILGKRWVRLETDGSCIHASVGEPVADWNWLTDYLQIEVDLVAILGTFPDNAPMRAAVGSCRGLRLLRQDNWECLASFLLSSTKQIVQIRQIISVLCERFGEPILALPGHPPAYAFPTAERLAQASESDLRACKMGFRAPYLLDTARRVVSSQIDLDRLKDLPIEAARSELMELPGIGRKIADCVLLFAYGFPAAFPVDVWVLKAFRQLYFPNRRPTTKRLLRFSETQFGPNAGYAQQYLFHYIRTRAGRTASTHEHENP
ncbi:MAG TPA: DNA glycosylase [Verrucomicrobiae bacterium]|nr:DNA glycosylase [Verrucomicrobiae bacterium]